MKTIRIRLYRILRTLGLQRQQINTFTNHNVELKFDQLDRKCFLFFLEDNFNINIPDIDYLQLKTIENTVNYIQNKVYVS